MGACEKQVTFRSKVHRAIDGLIRCSGCMISWLIEWAVVGSLIESVPAAGASRDRLL